MVLPLVVTWALGTLTALGLASFFVGQAWDRSLLDDAYAVASRVRYDAQDQPIVQLSPREIGTLLFDQSESVYFAVRRNDGQLIAGHGALHTPSLPPARHSAALAPCRAHRSA